MKPHYTSCARCQNRQTDGQTDIVLNSAIAMHPSLVLFSLSHTRFLSLSSYICVFTTLQQPSPGTQIIHTYISQHKDDLWLGGARAYTF